VLFEATFTQNQDEPSSLPHLFQRAPDAMFSSGEKGRCGRAGEDYQEWYRVEEKSSRRQKLFEAMRWPTRSASSLCPQYTFKHRCHFGGGTRF